MLNRSHRRLVGGLALALGLVGLAAPSATAVDDLGDLYVSPTTGGSNDFFVLETHAPCPEGTANVKASLNGPGITDTSANNLNGVTNYAATTPNGSGGFSLTVVSTLKDIFQSYGIIDPSGQYTINMRCQNSNGGTIFGDFLGKINVTDTATAFEATYAFVPPTPDGVATTTTLVATPASPVASGTAVTLTATVAPAAGGTVQFKDGATNLGAAVDVNGGTGVATSAPVVLGAGSHSLTAVFTSSNTDAFLNSTSAVTTYVVAGVPSVTGTAQVGRTLTCTTSAGGTQSFRWLVNGALSSATTKAVVAPGAWANKSVACRATFTHGGNSVVRVSPARKIALGAKLVYKVRPKVLGTTRVGRILTCSPGTWSPAATAYRYQWFRGALKLTGKTAKTYKAVAADRNKLVTCQVTALRTGHASGVAKAPARKIL